MKPKHFSLILLLAVAVLSLSGCAILKLPGMVIGESFKLVGKVLDIVSKLPKPPPGVF